MRSISPSSLRRSLVWRTTPRACVREGPARYDDEGSVREARGAVAVGAGAWWSAALTVPIERNPAAPVPVRVRLTRHGDDVPGQPGSAGIELLLPAAELAAVVTLLAGVTAQAARDGVLPAARG